MKEQEVLETSAKEYWDAGKDELAKHRCNSAVVLFFKALVALVDLYILMKTGHAPSSHAARFRTTKKRFPEVYNLVDKDFPFYQDSYVHRMTKEVAEVIRDDAQTMAEKTKVRLD